MLSLRRATTLTARRLSTKAKREYDLVLFGATGYSGRMCADYLLRTHKGLRVALAGRDRAKLEKVAEACAVTPPRIVVRRPGRRRVAAAGGVHGGRREHGGTLPQVRFVAGRSLCSGRHVLTPISLEKAAGR